MTGSKRTDAELVRFVYERMGYRRVTLVEMVPASLSLGDFCVRAGVPMDGEDGCEVYLAPLVRDADADALLDWCVEQEWDVEVYAMAGEPIWHCRITAPDWIEVFGCAPKTSAGRRRCIVEALAAVFDAQSLPRAERGEVGSAG